MPDIYIDADACPVKQEACRVAVRYGLNITFVSNTPMRVPAHEKSKQVVVKGGLNEADDWIVGKIQPDDIVVTADIPLANRSIKCGGRVIAPDGRIFSEDNIGQILATRDLLSELRGAGTITGGPRPFRKEDRSRFLHALDLMIQQIKRSRHTGGSDPF